MPENLRRGAFGPDPAVMHQNQMVGKTRRQAQIMQRDDPDRPPIPDRAPDLIQDAQLMIEIKR